MAYLRKSVKSLQVILNEFILYRKKDYTVTARAFSQARKKMKHSEFSEVNEGVVSLYYKDQKFKTCFGFRVRALDASKIILPTSVEIKNEFGSR